MPITILKNALFKINNLQVGYDQTGPFLTMTPGHAVSCVICVSKNRPIQMEDLQLGERELEILLNGGRMLDFPKQGYNLQGVTSHQLAAVSQFRGFQMEPPAYVQVWGMSVDNRTVTLHLPENPTQQCVLVPVGYCVERKEDGLCVRIQTMRGYQDGDLEYQIADHLPIPIPASGLNCWLPMRPDTVLVVKQKSGCKDKYVLKKTI